MEQAVKASERAHDTTADEKDLYLRVARTWFEIARDEMAARA